MSEAYIWPISIFVPYAYLISPVISYSGSIVIEYSVFTCIYFPDKSSHSEKAVIPPKKSRREGEGLRETDERGRKCVVLMLFMFELKILS